MNKYLFKKKNSFHVIDKHEKKTLVFFSQKSRKLWNIGIIIRPEMEFKEFEPRFKSAKTRFKLSAGLNLKTFDTILSRTNHI